MNLLTPQPPRAYCEISACVGVGIRRNEGYRLGEMRVGWGKKSVLYASCDIYRCFRDSNLGLGRAPNRLYNPPHPKKNKIYQAITNCLTYNTARRTSRKYAQRGVIWSFFCMGIKQSRANLGNCQYKTGDTVLFSQGRIETIQETSYRVCRNRVNIATLYPQTWLLGPHMLTSKLLQDLFDQYMRRLN